MMMDGGPLVDLDFQAVKSALVTLQRLRDLENDLGLWPELFASVEESVATMSSTTLYLPTGWLCLEAARAFRRCHKLSRRVWGGLATDATRAFSAAGADALVRVVEQEFIEEDAPAYNGRLLEPVKTLASDPSELEGSLSALHTGSQVDNLFRNPEDPTPTLGERLNSEGILQLL
jgi:hypothetical protein